MRSFLTTLTNFASRVFAFGAGLMLVLMFAAIFVNAVRRYLFGKSFEWGEELPVYLTIFGIMFGCALGYLDDRHVRLGIFVDMLSDRMRRWVFAFVDLVMIAAASLLSWSGWLFAARRGNVESSGLVSTTRSIADATGLGFLEVFGTMYPWQFAFCLGGAMIAVAALLKFLERISGTAPAAHAGEEVGF